MSSSLYVKPALTDRSLPRQTALQLNESQYGVVYHTGCSANLPGCVAQVRHANKVGALTLQAGGKQFAPAIS